MSSLRCRFCDHDNPGDARFCNACGSPVHLKPCPQCEAVNDVSASQCYECGATLEAGIAAEPGATPSAVASVAESSASTKPDGEPRHVPESFGARLADLPPVEGNANVAAAQRRDAFARTNRASRALFFAVLLMVFGTLGYYGFQHLPTRGMNGNETATAASSANQDQPPAASARRQAAAMQNQNAVTSHEQAAAAAVNEPSVATPDQATATAQTREQTAEAQDQMAAAPASEPAQGMTPPDEPASVASAQSEPAKAPSARAKTHSGTAKKPSGTAAKPSARPVKPTSAVEAVASDAQPAIPEPVSASSPGETPPATNIGAVAKTRQTTERVAGRIEPTDYTKPAPATQASAVATQRMIERYLGIRAGVAPQRSPY